MFNEELMHSQLNGIDQQINTLNIKNFADPGKMFDIVSNTSVKLLSRNNLSNTDKPQGEIQELYQNNSQTTINKPSSTQPVSNNTTTNNMLQEMANFMNPTKSVKLTPEQELAQLEAQLKQMQQGSNTNNSSTTQAVPKPAMTPQQELAMLQQQLSGMQGKPVPKPALTPQQELAMLQQQLSGMQVKPVPQPALTPQQELAMLQQQLTGMQVKPVPQPALTPQQELAMLQQQLTGMTTSSTKTSLSGMSPQQELATLQQQLSIMQRSGQIMSASRVSVNNSNKPVVNNISD